MRWTTHLLLAHAALAAEVLAYMLTKYFEPTLRVATLDWRNPVEYHTYTTIAEVTLTGTVTPTATSSATTSTDTQLTIVEVHIPTGYGKPLAWATGIRPFPSDIVYHAEVTYTNCLDGSERLSTFVTTATVRLPRKLTGYPLPTSIVNKTVMLDPSYLDAIDVASVSHAAEPSRGIACSRAVSKVDYRSICTTWIMTTTTELSLELTPTASETNTVPSRNEISCGKLNPCCYGCHAWQFGYIYTGPADWYECDDGRYLHPNGSEMGAEVTRYNDWDAKLRRATASKSTSSAATTGTDSAGDDKGWGVRSSTVVVPYLVLVMLVQIAILVG